jgi:hypothetical protein
MKRRPSSEYSAPWTKATPAESARAATLEGKGKSAMTRKECAAGKRTRGFGARSEEAPCATGGAEAAEIGADDGRDALTSSGATKAALRLQ